MGKKSGKRKISEVISAPEKDDVVELPASRMSDEPIRKKVKWTNKQRVLVFASRGISYRDRHLMEDLKKLMPHHKPEAKMERSKTLSVINEMCEMKNCNKAIMFEGRKKRDLYMWMANVPNGPSCKFLVENIYTMAEMKLTGNCLRGSRPLLSFDPNFNDKPEFMLLKELLQQIFGVPNHHPKSQPFFDHVYTFTVLDNRIWFRNFQILSDDGALVEIGPRFVLNPVKLFSGSFGGTTLWENSHYISPAKYRQQVRLVAKNKYVNRIEQKVNAEATKPKESYQLTPLDDIFKGDPYEKAKQMEECDLEEVVVEEEPKLKVAKKLKVKKLVNGNRKPKRSQGLAKRGVSGEKRGNSEKNTKSSPKNKKSSPKKGNLKRNKLKSK